MPRRELSVFAIACLVLGRFAHGAAPAEPVPTAKSVWVFPGPDGKLVYKSDAQGNRIPDFSNVGYRGGGVPLPELPVKAVVEPAPGDAGARIQAAIDEVSKLPADANGWRGAVLLKKGRYPVRGTLFIRTGGVALRGEGTSAEGTLLVATGSKQRSLIVAGVGSAAMPKDEDEEAEPETPKVAMEKRPITDEYVPVGAHTFHLASTDGLRVGEEIVVKRPSTAEWIHTIKMDQIPPAAHKVVQWKPGTFDLPFHRVITGIASNEVTIDAPIVCALEKKFGGAEVIVGARDSLIREVGVENLQADSEYRSPTDEEHGWVLLDLTGVRNAWVSHVVAVHFGYSCVYVRGPSQAVTIDNCACLDPISQILGGRRYCFALDGQLCLVERCYARNGRHDFVMHARAPGPNVFFDCVAEQSHADSGPHHRWSAGVLYDNVRISGSTSDPKHSGGELNIRDRGNSGTGHGWAGANQVAWNCRAEAMIVEQPPTAQNWAIGCITSSHSGNGYWDSTGHPVFPKSLYLAQLAERLGQQSP